MAPAYGAAEMIPGAAEKKGEHLSSSGFRFLLDCCILVLSCFCCKLIFS